MLCPEMDSQHMGGKKPKKQEMDLNSQNRHPMHQKIQVKKRKRKMDPVSRSGNPAHQHKC